MSRVCPQCSQVSTEATPFCIRCGHHFQGTEQIADGDATVRSANLANLPANADPAATFTPGGQQARAAQPPLVNALSYAQPAALGPFPYSPDQNQTPVPGGYAVPPLPQQGGYPSYGQPYGVPLQTVPGSIGVVSLQRAFAGKGTPVRHQSWLLDGKQAPPATLRNALVDNILKQNVVGVGAVPERLREQSVVMQERDYVKVQCGLSSVFVYLTPMGSSLYISRTSTVRQPVSHIRLMSLGGLFVLMLVSFLFYALVYPSATEDQGTLLLVGRINEFFDFVANGLLIFFLFVLLRSVISWLSENDFLAFFRPNRLNDFALDALSSIELVTDKGIRDTLKQAGLNADEITRPGQSYAPQLPLRRI